MFSLARILAGIFVAAPLFAQVTITGRIVDENGAGVGGARVALGSGPSVISDPTGAFSVDLPGAGQYLARVERDGFFPLKDFPVDIAADTREVHLTINHAREVFESTKVSASTGELDIDNTASERKLTGVEIIDIPYSPTRDLRVALTLIPGVLQDATGDLHFDGGAERQTLYLLDGFNFSDPLTGRLDAHLSVDSVRTIDWWSGRYSPEFGKGSGGALDIKTDMGNDPWRYSATDFIPGVDFTGGPHIGTWAPRANVSGPIKRGRIWFSDHLDAQYTPSVVPGLPNGQNRTQSFQTSNLLRTQVNLTPSNILFADFLVNYTFAPLSGLDALDPISTTTDQRSRTWFFSAKDQIYLTHRTLLEVGYAEDRNFFRVIPQGDGFYDISPVAKSGNYYDNSTQMAHRKQILSNLFLPSFEFLGHHQLKTGVDLDRLNYWQNSDRTGIDIFDATGAMVRDTVFEGSGTFSLSSAEESWYALDDWKIRKNVMVEYGVRQDWDELLDRSALSPRVAVSWSPFVSSNTKLSAGYAVVRDATSLQLFAQPLDQYAIETFINPANPAIVEMFQITDPHLLFPKYKNWTAGLDQRLPRKITLRLTGIRKTGTDGLAYTPESTPGLYDLTNARRDSYNAATILLDQHFGGKYEWMASYTRSRTYSNEALAFSVDQPLQVTDNVGPAPWDAPNRFVSWAYLPTRWQNWAVAYSIEVHTGFPYSIVDGDGRVVGPVDSQRLPMFLSLNIHPEYKFNLFGRRWALRGGFNNITNHNNPVIAQTVPGQPVRFFGSEGRHFVVRVRWLGKQG
jgi:hypothetical protein